MPDLLSEAESLYGTSNLYEVFGVSKTATASQLKKAFYKQSLKVHPDKVTEVDKSLATQKFQLISKLYQFLSDEKKRDVYDKTGEIDEEDAFDWSNASDLMSYWRELFPAVSTEDVEKFHNEYKGSDEELSSLKEAYLSSKGNMQHVIDSVMCASVEDEERFKKLLEPLVKSKELPSYKKFFKEPAASKKKRHSKAVAESKEAEKLKKELKGDSSSGYADLALAMQRNREKRGDIFSYLESKYGDAEDDSISSADNKRPKKDLKRKADSKSSGSKRRKKAGK